MSNCRDKFTEGLQSEYARKVFFGDIKITDVPKDKLEEVKKELDENGLSYLYTEDCKDEI